MQTTQLGAKKQLEIKLIYTVYCQIVEVCKH